MQHLELIVICFLQFLVYYTVFILLTTSFMKSVNAIPQINMTNPYYERHLEHINSA